MVDTAADVTAYYLHLADTEGVGSLGCMVYIVEAGNGRYEEAMGLHRPLRGGVFNHRPPGVNPAPWFGFHDQVPSRSGTKVLW